MSTEYVYTETDHLDHHSIFYSIQLPNDKDLLEAIKVWELAADAKYIDILGYGQCMLYASIDPQDCAKIEVDKIDNLLNTGSCELLTGYTDFDLEQIPLAYKAMQRGRWNDFISVKATKAYLGSEQDDERLGDYFSRKWVVATQVQALIWYKKFMLDVVKNGISFREDKEPMNNDEASIEKPTNGKNTIVSNRFVLEGNYWNITFNQKPVMVNNTKGIRYIEYLIRNKGKEVHVSELFYAINPTDATHSNESLSDMSEEQLVEEGFSLGGLGNSFELTDEKTIAALKLYIEQLDDQIEEAKEYGEIEKKEQLEAKKDHIVARLRADTGLGGKSRQSNSAIERTRKSVEKRIHTDIKKLQKDFPEFADHLQAIKTGTYCQYKPVPEIFWEFSPKN